MSDNFFDPNNPDGDDPNAPVASAAKPEAYESLSALIRNESTVHSEAEGEVHRLENKFEDPAILTELGTEASADPLSLILDAHAAVEDLVSGKEDANAIPIDLGNSVEAPLATAADFIPATTVSEVPSDLIQTDNGDMAYLAAKVGYLEEFQELIVSEHSFEILVEKGLQILMRSVDAQAGSVLELDNDKEEYFFRASRGGASDQVQNFRVPVKQGIVGYVGESRDTLLINELEDDKLQLKSISVAVGFEARSCLATPIVVANKLYGVVEVFNKMGTLYFLERDKKILADGAKAFAKVLEVRFLMAELLKRGRG